MAALGLVAKVLEGKGGQVDVSLFDVMLSQLNYKAAAYLNGGEAPTRQPLGAHTFYVPAQLFETASGYLALFVTPRRVLAPRSAPRSVAPSGRTTRASRRCTPGSSTATSSSRRSAPSCGRRRQPSG